MRHYDVIFICINLFLSFKSDWPTTIKTRRVFKIDGWYLSNSYACPEVQRTKVCLRNKIVLFPPSGYINIFFYFSCNVLSRQLARINMNKWNYWELLCYGVFTQLASVIRFGISFQSYTELVQVGCFPFPFAFNGFDSPRGFDGPGTLRKWISFMEVNTSLTIWMKIWRTLWITTFFIAPRLRYVYFHFLNTWNQ